MSRKKIDDMLERNEMNEATSEESDYLLLIFPRRVELRWWCDESRWYSMKETTTHFSPNLIVASHTQQMSEKFFTVFRKANWKFKYFYDNGDDDLSERL